MDAETKAALAELTKRIDGLVQRLDAQARGAGASSTQPGVSRSYLLSDPDRRRRDEALARAQAETDRTGIRPLGGGAASKAEPKPPGKAPGLEEGGAWVDTVSPQIGPKGPKGDKGDDGEGGIDAEAREKIDELIAFLDALFGEGACTGEGEFDITLDSTETLPTPFVEPEA